MASAHVLRAVAKVNESLVFEGRPSREQVREAVDAMWPEPDADVTLSPATIAGVPGRWVSVPDTGSSTVLYLHGGGFTSGSSVSHRELAARISRATTSRVFVADYSLSPEHAFPVALEEMVGVVDALVADEQVTDVFVAGESAGGGLALSTTLRLIERGGPLPTGVFVMSPWADLTLESESFATNVGTDPMGDPRAYTAMARGYLDGHDARDPLASPALADYAGFPPLLVQAGSSELIVDDTFRVADAARRAGVEVELQISPGACHAFQLFGDLPESRQALAEVGRFVRGRTLARD